MRRIWFLLVTSLVVSACNAHEDSEPAPASATEDTHEEAASAEEPETPDEPDLAEAPAEGARDAPSTTPDAPSVEETTPPSVGGTLGNGESIGVRPGRGGSGESQAFDIEE